VERLRIELGRESLDRCGIDADAGRTAKSLAGTEVLEEKPLQGVVSVG
jgi:hypothetical protein